MERRALLGLISTPWLFTLPGCIFQRYSDQGLGRSADLVIWNLTEHDQSVAVAIRDESEETIYSEQYELSPEDTENYNAREPDVARASRTYHVEVVTDNQQATHELEVPQAGVIDITIHEREIGFSFGPAEG